MLSNAEARSRFLREGYVANKVGHPGTVQVLDDDTDEDGSVFLVMELLEGESFETRRARSQHVLSAIDVLKVADRVLDVLASAHDKGIVHRDIKPDNIFLTSDGGVKLLDFGIARLRDSMRRATMTSGGAIGTPAFMPPEQARGRWDDVGPRTDIWALGATMFTALTGRLVHEAETVNELLLAAMTKPAPPLSSILPGVPSAVATVVDRALAHDMDARWSDARTMQTMVRMAFQALGDPGGAGAGRWGGTLRMPSGGATPDLRQSQGGAPRGSIPALGGMMAVPLVAPARSSIPSLPGVPFQMADPLTGPRARGDARLDHGLGPRPGGDARSDHGFGPHPGGDARLDHGLGSRLGDDDRSRWDGAAPAHRSGRNGAAPDGAHRSGRNGAAPDGASRSQPAAADAAVRIGWVLARDSGAVAAVDEHGPAGDAGRAAAREELRRADHRHPRRVDAGDRRRDLHRAAPRAAPELPGPAVAPTSAEPSAAPVVSSAAAAPEASVAPKLEATAPEPSATATATATARATGTPRKPSVVKKR